MSGDFRAGSSSGPRGGQPPHLQGTSAKKKRGAGSSLPRVGYVVCRGPGGLASARPGGPLPGASGRGTLVSGGCGGWVPKAGGPSARRGSEPRDAFRQQREEAIGMDIAHEHRVGLCAPSRRHQSATVMPRVSSPFVSISTLMWRPVKRCGLDQVGDHAGVVQRRALGCRIWPCRSVRRNRSSRRRSWPTGVPSARNAVDARRGGQGLVGDVERHHHQGHAGSEHDISGFRVDVDVELGGGRDVADLEISRRPSARSRPRGRRCRGRLRRRWRCWSAGRAGRG